MFRSLITMCAAGATLFLTACATTEQSASHDHRSMSGGDTGEIATASATPDTAPLASDSASVLVSGLSCPKCATNVELALMDVPGVTSAQIDFETGAVQLMLGKQKPSAAQLAQAVEKAGFTYRGIRTP